MAPMLARFKSAGFFLVYATVVNNLADLQQQVADGHQVIQNTPGIFKRVWQSLLQCAQRCVEVNGQHFKNLFQHRDCCHLSCRMCTRKINTLNI
jgi:hypothetical protein